MGDCVYCGHPAGFLRTSHRKCRELHELAEQKIPTFFARYLQSDIAPSRFNQLATEIARTHFMSKDQFRRFAILGISQAVDAAFADHVITVEETDRIMELWNELQITKEEFEPSGTRVKLSKAAILRELDDGIVPHHAKIVGATPINLQKGEQIIWIFNNVSYYTVRTKTSYVGGSHGVSVRIARGVYYRVGAFRGERVQTQNLVLAGNGDLVITNKNIYFYSDATSFRIQSEKIVSVNAYSDGIQITKEAATPKPQLFILDDPWFAANVISRLGQL